MSFKLSSLLIPALLVSTASLAQAHPKYAPDTEPEQQQQHSHQHAHEHGDEHQHDDEFTQLGTHVHGAATLTMVLEGNELQLALQSAAFNIVGFEQAPKTSEQKQEVALALDNLAQGNWFSVSSEANCEIQGADANTDLTEPGYSGHGDFYANVSLLCQSPARLHQLDLSLFNLTPALEKIDVQWVLNGQQGAATATLSNSRIQF